MSEAGHAQPVLTTRRMRLRGLIRADAALIELYASDPKVARMTTSIPHPYPPGFAETYVERNLNAAPLNQIWALDAGSEGENGLIGLIRCKLNDAGGAEIGYWVAPALWGAGYASEAVRAVVAHLADTGIPTVAAQVFQDNKASARVLMRCEFSYLGEGETHSTARGAMVPTFRYQRDTRIS